MTTLFPDAIKRPDGTSEAGWKVKQVKPSDSYINWDQKMAAVPRPRDEDLVAVRFHELGHVKYSPKKPPTVLTRDTDIAFYKMLEENRVDTLLNHESKLDMSHRHDAYKVGDLVPDSDHAKAELISALGWLQIYGQRESESCKPVFEELQKNIKPSRLEHLKMYLASLNNKAKIDYDKGESVIANYARTLGMLFDPPVADPKMSEKNPESEDKPKPQTQQTATTVGNGRSEYTLCKHITRTNPGKTLRKPKGSAPKGLEPKNVQRWTTDKHIFVHRRPAMSMTIDASGSMDWDYEELAKGMKQFPASIISVYSGTHRRGQGNGVLCVVAENGRWDNPEVRSTRCGADGNNEIDLEALQWLAKQKGPRVWLSDGEACGGALDRYSLRKEIVAIGKKYRIVRAPTIESAINYLTKGRDKDIVFATDGDYVRN